MLVKKQSEPPPLTTEASPAPVMTTNDDILGDRAQAIIAVNQKLKELGIDQTISLPQIVVIGDQSAGKSSLIEAISNIQVPKAEATTCTRCPIAINLRSGDGPDSPWTCKVSIEERYDYDSAKKVTNENPLGPWQKRVDMRVIEMETTGDKSKVSQLITEAQNKVLSMPFDHATIANTSTRSKKNTSVMFSPNVVRLDISEGIRANLCFIDLPGVISSAGSTQNAYLVRLVTNLVKQYAKDPRNENILTLPMNMDVQTSNTCSIVQELQVEQRTLAVFTKPDRAKSSEQRLIINNYLRQATGADEDEDDERMRFQNGCHFVMLANSNQGELLDTEEEHKYFQQGVWKELQTEFGHRMGVPALSNYLRDQLFRKTCEALPENLQAIEKELKNIESILKDLPPPPDKMFFCMEMQQILETFSSAMDGKFPKDGHGTISGLLRAKFEAFADSLNEASPLVEHSTKKERQKKSTAVEAVNKIVKPKKNVKPEEISDDDDVEDSQETSGKKFRLAELCKINQTFRHSGLPGEVDPRAVTKACKDATDCWNAMIEQFLLDMHEFLDKQVKKVFKTVFDKYQNLGIYSMVDNWINEYLQTAMRHEHQIAMTNCLAERSTPFTLNLEALDVVNEVKEKELMNERLAYRLKLANCERDVEEGVIKKDRKDVNKDTIGRDEYKAEMILGAKVQAYYEIASNRFIDTICQGFYSRMLPICGEELVAALKSDIGIRDPKNEDQITAWMVEDANKEQQRQRLTNKREQLLEGRKYIESVLGSTSTSQSSPSKRASSPSSATAMLVDTPSKRQKIAHRPGSADPVTPRTELTKSLEDVKMSN